MNKQHNPNTELPPRDNLYKHASINVLILDKWGNYTVGFYTWYSLEWVTVSEIPLSDFDILNIRAWWYLPTYNETT